MDILATVRSHLVASLGDGVRISTQNPFDASGSLPLVTIARGGHGPNAYGIDHLTLTLRVTATTETEAYTLASQVIDSLWALHREHLNVSHLEMAGFGLLESTPQRTTYQVTAAAVTT